MNKEAYLKELSRGLSKLPKNEREEALQYYVEYFQDTDKSEEEAIETLGKPSYITNSILAEFNVAKMDTITSSTKKGASAIGTILLLVFAAPMGLPIAILLGFVVLLLAISVAVLIISLGVTGICAAVSGIIITITALTILPTHAPTAVLSVGIGLTALGVGVILSYGTFHFANKILSGLVAFVKNRVAGRRLNETNR